MSKEISKEEFYKKCKNVLFTFSDYYKFTFNYTGILNDELTVYIGVGGCSDEIYRLEVTSHYSDSIYALEPYKGMISKDGVEIEYFYDY